MILDMTNSTRSFTQDPVCLVFTVIRARSLIVCVDIYTWVVIQHIFYDSFFIGDSCAKEVGAGKSLAWQVWLFCLCRNQNYQTTEQTPHVVRPYDLFTQAHLTLSHRQQCMLLHWLCILLKAAYFKALLC